MLGKDVGSCMMFSLASSWFLYNYLCLPTFSTVFEILSFKHISIGRCVFAVPRSLTLQKVANVRTAVGPRALALPLGDTVSISISPSVYVLQTSGQQCLLLPIEICDEACRPVNAANFVGQQKLLGLFKVMSHHTVISP